MSLLEMTDISKAFSGITVLSHVDFDVKEGEVHALLGENGAGKSTLMNVMTGVVPCDSGHVTFDGVTMKDITIQNSEKMGIAFVHQELNLFNDLKVYENIFLRKELLTKLHTLDKRAMIKQTEELFESLGVEIDPTALVSELETSKKQLLEIAKALHAQAKLFILDEPTTALNNAEIDHLFTIVRRLKEQGKAFIFISHKMNEIFTIADRYTILRNGEFIEEGYIKDTTPESVARLMVGNNYDADQTIYKPRQLGEVVLETNDISGEGFHNVNLSVRKGEIVGLTGLKGSGVSETLQAIFGATAIEEGTITINGKTLKNHSIHKAMVDKIGMIPANRKENSIIPDFSLLDNNAISERTLNKKPVIARRKEVAQYNDMKKLLNIKANDYNDLITSLSGGNQQKVILARWLTTKADILLMDNPTQGIDVGAKAEIYKLIVELAESGKTILVNTLEIPEIQKIADRCIVFFRGTIHAEIPREELTEENVMLYATNAKQMKGEQ